MGETWLHRDGDMPLAKWQPGDLTVDKVVPAWRGIQSNWISQAENATRLGANTSKQSAFATS